MSAFMSRSINLSGLSAASLSFWFKIPSIEQSVDLAQVLIDGTVVWSSSAPATTWTQATISLNSFLGGLRTLQFAFVSDASLAFEGWYVDDVLVTNLSANIALATSQSLRTVDGPWADKVKLHTVSKIKKFIPSVPN